MGRGLVSCRFQIPNGGWKLVEDPPWKLLKNYSFEKYFNAKKNVTPDPSPTLFAFPFSPLSSCQVTWAPIISFQLPQMNFPLEPNKRHYPGRTGFPISFHNPISFSEDHVFSLIHFNSPSCHLPLLYPTFTSNGTSLSFPTSMAMLYISAVKRNLFGKLLLSISRHEDQY